IIDAGSWEMPYLFQWLKGAGNVAEQEMYRVFNCGIGMVVVVDPALADQAAAMLREAGETVHVIGHIARRGDGQAATVVA
ncbi:MAG: phosphoribosylformylglycinamidine cyclo-ligase, partial [Rhodocyclaceae bacterium]|nr:phosphoribosylformylglycinamidine cyclo-ligase [Rhodocyclaceae bacterium]